MKFQIEKDVFQEALNQVQHVVSTRTTLPILSNVLIEADELGLQLSTTDLDVTITKRVAAKVERTGATTLPARRLASIVRELPTSEINFEVNEDDAATVKSGPSFFKILGLPSTEFPAIGEFGFEGLGRRSLGAVGIERKRGSSPPAPPRTRRRDPGSIHGGKNAGGTRRQGS